MVVVRVSDAVMIRKNLLQIAVVGVVLDGKNLGLREHSEMKVVLSLDYYLLGNKL